MREKAPIKNANGKWENQNLVVPSSTRIFELILKQAHKSKSPLSNKWLKPKRWKQSLQSVLINPQY